MENSQAKNKMNINNKKAPVKKVQTTPLNTGMNLSNLTRRVRMLEERYTKINDRIDVDEHAELDFKKKVNIEVRTINSELDEIKRDLSEIKEKMTMIVKELKTTARKSEVSVIKKYLDMWQPLDFVTRKEFDEKLKELKEGNQKF